MDAVDVQRHGHVDTVIDQQADLTFSRECPHILGQAQESSAIEVLFPKLDGPHSGGQGLCHQWGEWPAKSLPTIRDEVQPKINARHQKRMAGGKCTVLNVYGTVHLDLA
jgi:hypothetical protein